MELIFYFYGTMNSTKIRILLNISNYIKTMRVMDALKITNAARMHTLDVRWKHCNQPPPQAEKKIPLHLVLKGSKKL